MLLSAVSVLVVAQSSSEIPEGLMNNPVYEDEVPGWALKSKSTNHPDHGHHGFLPPPGNIPMVEPGIEPGTS